MAHWILLLTTLAVALPAAAQPGVDSLIRPAAAETLWVIPAGPTAGSFTPAARLQIEDTVAGWAKVRVEGWVPVRAVLEHLGRADTAAVEASTRGGIKAVIPGKCQALTKKGAPCKRKARPGSSYCWQHQK